MSTAQKLPAVATTKPAMPVIGVCATCDPRIDAGSRSRATNIVQTIAGHLAGGIQVPGRLRPRVVWAATLIDGERQADIVAQQFKEQGVGVLVCVPDTWAFPQLGLISLLSHFPADTPLNLTCGNSGPKPGVVFTHAASGAISQYGRLVHINVGTWDDTGLMPAITPATRAI